MKIVNVIGGLGNQLFQYAFAIALKAEFPNEEVKINTICFRNYPLHNGYELDKLFKVEMQYATLSDLFKYAYPWWNYRLWQIGHNLLPLRHSMARDTNFKSHFNYKQIENKIYFDGYWQSPKFFNKHRDAILKAFVFPPITGDKNKDAISFINNAPTAFIHIRRGDYINHPLFGGICTLDYYKNAINILRNEYSYNQFLIFSTDIVWCQANLSDYLSDASIKYVDWNKGQNSHFDLQLMSKCKGGIVANSSFSWWGAWLANSEVIVCPSKWATDPNINSDIIPESWIKCKI